MIIFNLTIFYKLNFTFFKFLNVVSQLALGFSHLELFLCIIFIVSFDISSEWKIVILFNSFDFTIFIQLEILIKLVHFKSVIRSSKFFFLSINIPFFFGWILFFYCRENFMQIPFLPNFIQKQFIHLNSGHV